MHTFRMRNMGPVSRRWLAEIHIYNTADLRRVGAAAAFRMIKAQQPQVTLNLLWALEGAIRDKDWRQLPEPVRLALIREIDDYRP